MDPSAQIESFYKQYFPAARNAAEELLAAGMRDTNGGTDLIGHSAGAMGKSERNQSRKDFLIFDDCHAGHVVEAFTERERHAPPFLYGQDAERAANVVVVWSAAADSPRLRVPTDRKERH